MYIRVLFEKLLRTQRTTSNSEYPGKLRSAQIAPFGRNFGYSRNVVRKAERQDNEEEVELMINTFLNPAPRTPAVHGGLKRRTF